jgi:hypothetical protein
VTPTPAQWFRTRPNTPPDIRTHQQDDGEWEVLLCVESGIDNAEDAERAAALLRMEMTVLTHRAHAHDEYQQPTTRRTNHHHG